VSDGVRESHGEMVARFGGAAEVICVDGDVDIKVRAAGGAMLGRAVIADKHFPALMAELRRIEDERARRRA
jgi:hypothetical protein